jgi:hypothetical protein
MADTIEQRLADAERKLRAMGVLVDFLIAAAPHFTTHYYPTGKIVGGRLAQTVIDGEVVSEGVVGGKVEARSFQTDLRDAEAEADRILAEK